MEANFATCQAASVLGRRRSEAVKVEASLGEHYLEGRTDAARLGSDRGEVTFQCGRLCRSATGSVAAGDSTHWRCVSADASGRSEAGESAGPPRRLGWRGEGPCFTLVGRGRLEQPSVRAQQANTDQANSRRLTKNPGRGRGSPHYSVLSEAKDVSFGSAALDSPSQPGPGWLGTATSDKSRKANSVESPWRW